MRKDESLDCLAAGGNVAQFVSFKPGDNGELVQTFSRLAGFEANARFDTVRGALEALLALSPEGAINIRSYEPENPRSREFVYGLSTLDAALSAAERLCRQGLFVIANETIDVRDGGVSGVMQGDIIEFAPDDTPRCVEKHGVASLPRAWGLSILRKVYGSSPDDALLNGGRLEFSIHPRRRGYKRGHVLAWEYEDSLAPGLIAKIGWPNRFSRHIGDKAFGLLIAEEIGLPVPQTTVFGRRVAPFTFGAATGSNEVWTRTCPAEPEPGRYTTMKGWTDPFELLRREDPSGGAIISVLCQNAVEASYSGAAIVGNDSNLIVEGRSGEGDALMLGTKPPEPLPESILADVRKVYDVARSVLGPVRFEWVHDGVKAWIVQLHVGGTASSQTVLVPGTPERWMAFDVRLGLAALRDFLSKAPEGSGVEIVGDIGLTSHLADVLRKAGLPSRIAAATN